MHGGPANGGARPHASAMLPIDINMHVYGDVPSGAAARTGADEYGNYPKLNSRKPLTHTLAPATAGCVHTKQWPFASHKSEQLKVRI